MDRFEDYAEMYERSEDIYEHFDRHSYDGVEDDYYEYDEDEEHDYYEEDEQ